MIPQPIKVVFFGSPSFAVPTLQALARDPSFDVRLVVTQRDRPSGRGKHLKPPGVKIAAQELGLPIWQPTTLRAPEAVDYLEEIAADLYVVVAYGEIFRRDVLSLPPHGILNVHPSLLPRYRGSSPIPAAIRHGEEETGVSIIQMVRKLDAGPIVAQEVVALSGPETAGELSERLAQLAGQMLPDVALNWVAGRIEARPQAEEIVSFTRELRKGDGRINWEQSAEEIERLVRAMNPWPMAWTSLDGNRLQVAAVDISQKLSHMPPGLIHRTPAGIAVGTRTRPLILRRVHPEGRRELTAEEWYRGARLGSGSRFA
jgi:methionyl-tRNA formyltransferase